MSKKQPEVAPSYLKNAAVDIYGYLAHAHFDPLSFQMATERGMIHNTAEKVFPVLHDAATRGFERLATLGVHEAFVGAVVEFNKSPYKENGFLDIVKPEQIRMRVEWIGMQDVSNKFRDANLIIDLARAVQDTPPLREAFKEAAEKLNGDLVDNLVILEGKYKAPDARFNGWHNYPSVMDEIMAALRPTRHAPSQPSPKPTHTAGN